MPFQEQSFDDISRLLMQSGGRVDPAMLRRSLASSDSYANDQGAGDAAARGLNQRIFDRQLALRRKGSEADRKANQRSRKYAALGAGLGLAGNLASGFLSPEQQAGDGLDPMTGYPKISTGYP